MKKLLSALSLLSLLFMGSCEVEYRGDVRYYHHRGYEHDHYPDHREAYHHGYHHDEHGNESHHDH